MVNKIKLAVKWSVSIWDKIAIDQAAAHTNGNTRVIIVTKGTSLLCEAESTFNWSKLIFQLLQYVCAASVSAAKLPLTVLTPVGIGVVWHGI